MKFEVVDCFRDRVHLTVKAQADIYLPSACAEVFKALIENAKSIADIHPTKYPKLSEREKGVSIEFVPHQSKLQLWTKEVASVYWYTTSVWNGERWIHYVSTPCWRYISAREWMERWGGIRSHTFSTVVGSRKNKIGITIFITGWEFRYLKKIGAFGDECDENECDDEAYEDDENEYGDEAYEDDGNEDNDGELEHNGPDTTPFFWNLPLMVFKITDRHYSIYPYNREAPIFRVDKNGLYQLTVSRSVDEMSLMEEFVCPKGI